MKRTRLLCIFFVLLFSFLGLRIANSEIFYSAKAVCLYDATDNQIIYGYNENEKMAPASITKIVTAITALEMGKLSSSVTVDRKSAMTEGSSIYLKEGERLTLEQLLYGLMLNSGNDAANAVASYFGYDSFVSEMNKLALWADAHSSSFENPSGLDGENHYVTAADMAKIAAYALKNEDFSKIVATRTAVIKSENGTERYLKNHNKLLWDSEDYIGVKTGFTKKAGRTLVSAMKKNGKTYICVTLKAPDDWNDHRRIYKNYIKDKELKE